MSYHGNAPAMSRLVSKNKNETRDEKSMRVAYCLVTRDDLICRADWLWGQVGGASRGQAFRSTRLKEEQSLFPSGC